MRVPVSALCLSFAFGCGGHITPDGWERGVPPVPPALGGTEVVRVSADVVVARHRFGARAPLRYEVHLPAGVRVPGEGLPGVTSDSDTGTGALEDRTILQVELPVAQDAGGTDEAGRTAGFDPPRLCSPGTSCAFGANDDGRWRAYRVRGSRWVELTLTPILDAEVGGQPELQARLLGVWMDASLPPLDARDRIVFLYVGHAPPIANDWLPGAALKPRVRFREDHGAVGCPASQRDCWTVVPPGRVQGLVIEPDVPTTLNVIAPLDVEAGVPFVVKVVATDRWQNPAPITADLQLTVDGTSVGNSVSLVDAFRGEAEVVLPDVGPVSVRTQAPAGMSLVYHWSQVWPMDALSTERLVGDVHLHSGGSGDHGFLRSWFWGDHLGQFVRGEHALQYLDKVAGYDFGALSEHSGDMSQREIPPTGFAAWQPGGVCAPSALELEDLGDWWTESQRISAAYDRDNLGFFTFPAFEWHGLVSGPDINSKLHRIVMYRDHAPNSWDLPVLSGNTENRPPHCLYGFLDASGYTPDQVLVMQHAMTARTANRDHDLTYAAGQPWEGVADRALIDSFTTVGEIFSTRNYNGRFSTADRLSAFEGRSADPTAEPWTLRYAWRDSAAVLGVIGAGDGHVGRPGADDPWTDGVEPDLHVHEPGGAAFVLTPTQPVRARDAVFDALHARHTYGTSGIRAWFDLQLTSPSGAYTMGDEVGDVAECGIDGHTTLMVGRPVRALEVFGVPVGSANAYVSIASATPETERAELSFVLENPVAPGSSGDARWVYYVRAHTGRVRIPGESDAAFAQSVEDAVWSSPVWVDWKAPLTACP